MDRFKNILILCLTLLIISSVIESRKLKLVIVLHRHGDRTPVFTYPTDPYGDFDKYWPDGLGHLTIKGKQRMNSIGKYLRKRYKNFLTENPREVWVRSSEKERCLESVTLILSGLYPPNGRWKWNNDVGQVWQPFPIHTMNISHDGLVCPESICPKAQRESLRILQSDVVQNYLKKHERSIKLIEQKTGLQVKHYWMPRDLFSSLEIQKLNGLTLPDWVDQELYQTLYEMSNMAFVYDSSTQMILRMRTGKLLKKIVTDIEKVIKTKKFPTKMFLYSTHDTYLSVFLQALGAFNAIGPPFGATVLFELWEQTEDQHKLELHYLNETFTEKPFKMPLNCGNSGQKREDCPLNEFLKAVEKLVVDDWEKECLEEPKPEDKQETNIQIRLKFEL